MPRSAPMLFPIQHAILLHVLFPRWNSPCAYGVHCTLHYSYYGSSDPRVPVDGNGNKAGEEAATAADCQMTRQG